MLLTYKTPGVIWARMSEAERAAEEAEYRDLIQSMQGGLRQAPVRAA
jgi:hypothetical protein